MKNSLLFNIKNYAIRFTAVTFLASLLGVSAYANNVDSTLQFFEGALLVQVKGPKTLTAGKSGNNPFSLLVTDTNGSPYPAITKQWIRASVEMTNMDMGLTKVTKIEDILDSNKKMQGQILVNPTFSMRGPWKLNLTIMVTGDDGNPIEDTQFVTFDVNN